MSRMLDGCVLPRGSTYVHVHLIIQCHRDMMAWHACARARCAATDALINQRSGTTELEACVRDCVRASVRAVCLCVCGTQAMLVAVWGLQGFTGVHALHVPQLLCVRACVQMLHTQAEAGASAACRFCPGL